MCSPGKQGAKKGVIQLGKRIGKETVIVTQAGYNAA
jgi:hypothetical protein